jgi:hypothetical protein
MKKSKFTSSQIAGILMAFYLGKSVDEIIREHATFYKLRQRYGGMEASGYLPAGIYILRIEQAGRLAYKKVLLQ